jgi:hypothetical protein
MHCGTHGAPRELFHRALARDPEFFVDLIKLIFLPDEGSGIVEADSVDPAKAQDSASHAYNVLDEWSHVPGADDQGEIDGESLELWIKQARKLLSEAGRTTIGDQKIGEILSAAKRKPGTRSPRARVCSYRTCPEQGVGTRLGTRRV